MSNHTPTPGDQSNPDPIADLEARLAEIEAGLLDPFAFTSRTLIQTTFPHSARAGKELTLVNGDTTLTMYSRHGLPYGTYPRLLVMWLTREALRRSSLPLDEARVIPLSGNMSSFMREVGIKNATGGKKGTVTMLRKQMKSLFSTMIGRDFEGYTGDRDMVDLDNTLVAEKAHLWWDPKPEDEIDFGGHVTLSTAFYQDLMSAVVPLDAGMVGQLRRSPLALDMYCWLTYRLSYLRGITVVTWNQLRGQFGAGYPETPQGRQDLKKKLRVALGKVEEVWPEVSASFTANGIMLRPGSPSVPRKVGEEITRRYPEGHNPF